MKVRNVRGRRRALVGFALLLLASGPATSAAVEGAHPGGEDPSCSAVTKARPGKTRNVVYRARCNFEVAELTIHTNSRVYGVQRRPRLDNGDPGDSSVCRRGSRDFRGRLDRRDVLCRGTVGAGARIVGAFRVNGDPCAVRTRFAAYGGVDGEEGEAVPRIGYSATIQRKRPRGC